MGFYPRLVRSFGLILLGASSAAQATEVMHMPFDCHFDGARVHLRPSDERSYTVISRREREVFTTCSPADPDRCSSWLVHRFDFDCNGDRVAWLDAAAAATRYADWDAWARDGRFRMRMGPMWGVARARPDIARRRWMRRRYFRPDPREAFGPNARDVYRARIVSVPPGFAPAVGIPLTFSGGTPDLAEAPAATPSAPAIAAYTAAEPARPPIPDLPERAPPREQRLAAASPPPPLVAPAPKPAVKTAAMEQPGKVASKTQAPPADAKAPEAAVDAAGSKKAAADTKVKDGVATATKTQGFTIINAPHSDAAKPPANGRPAPTDTTAVMPQAAQSAKSTLPDTGLSEPTDATQPPPASETASEPAAPTMMAMPALSLQTAAAAAMTLALAGLAVFGIRRWRRRPFAAPPADRDIADISFDGARRAPAALERGSVEPGAPASESQNREAAEDAHKLPVPTTYAEALKVLGASPDASTGAIKKIVDGLRQSWHPDLARSEADRRHREARVRQINVAWDLVSQRRSAA